MTPMMKQYHAMKRRYEGAVLFFHLGDFYEAFYEDASTCSDVLGITLTSRRNAGGTIPMAGIPIRASQGYMEKLLRAGYRVAVCDQVEDPSLSKGIVKREVTRVLTPGTVTEGGLVDDKDNNFLLAVCPGTAAVGLSWVDLSTGEFLLADCDESMLTDELPRINPSEVLVPESASAEITALLSSCGCMVTTQTDQVFDRDTCLKKLLDHFQVASLDGFGCADAGPSVTAAGAALNYLHETQKGALSHISSVRMYSQNTSLAMDRTTRRNLDLLRAAATGDKRHSLFGTIDRTVTGMGGRLLQSWLSTPLIDVQAISARHEAVEELTAQASRDRLRTALKDVKDMERLCGRVARRRANGRDMIALRNSIRAIPEIHAALGSVSAPLLRKTGGGIDKLADVESAISKVLVDEPPVEITDGGLITDGVDEELDDLRNITRDGKGWITSLESKEKERTGINSLKIGFNRVFGYYIEVTHTHGEKIPPHYVRKQTLNNAERYITEELKEYETKVLTSEEKSKEIEYRIFTDLRESVAGETGRIQQTARALARVDALTSLAQVAVENNYCRPVMTENVELCVKEGRHPVVEKTLKPGEFTPNDTDFDDEKGLVILTGPNMSGKSTYIRQVALITIMAQSGGFVPAEKATIGVVDRVFTRIGASDEIARGQSTFMVEMNETALILNNATEKSLIILDEVGRGTSTLDGLSIARAVAENIHDKVGARTLFATHYHELTELAASLARAVNYNVAVREWGDEVVFLHKIEPGETDKSYGIHVARLAGVPADVIDRAKDILQGLETKALDSSAEEKESEHKGQTQLPLFASQPSKVEEDLLGMDTDNITPVDALLKLRELKDKINGRKDE